MKRSGQVLTSGRAAPWWGTHSPRRIGGKARAWKGNLFYYTLYTGTTDFNPLFHNASSNVALTAVMPTCYLWESLEEQWSWGHSPSAPSLPLSCSRAMMSGFQYQISNHCSNKLFIEIEMIMMFLHLTEFLWRLNESEHQKGQKVPFQTCNTLDQASWNYWR